MFGTFAAQRPGVCRLRLVHPIRSYNPLIIVFHEWFSMLRDVMRSRSGREVVVNVLGRPGANPPRMPASVRECNSTTSS